LETKAQKNSKLPGAELTFRGGILGCFPSEDIRIGRYASDTTGTENYRRIRNPDRSQIPGLYIHQNGLKVQVQSYRAVDTSTFRQNISETRLRAPANHSYYPGAARDTLEESCIVSTTEKHGRLVSVTEGLQDRFHRL
jgi:hypothetical protein